MNRRKRHYLQVFGLATVVLGSLIAVIGCNDAVTTGTVDSVAGNGVFIKTAADAAAGWKPLAKGQALAFDDEIKVDGKDAIVKLHLVDTTRITLVARNDPRDPKRTIATEFSIKGFRQGSSYRSLMMKLTRGIAALVVPPNRPNKDHLEVQASYTTTAIRGTELKVESGEDCDRVSVKQGDVDVSVNSNPSQVQNVKATESVTYDPKSGFGAHASYNPLATDAERGLYDAGDEAVQKHF